MTVYDAYAGGRIDFSPLGEIGDKIGGAIGDYRQQQRIKSAWEQSGGDYNKATQALLAMGDDKSAAVLSAIQDKINNGSGTIYGTPIWGTDTTTGKEGVGAIGKDAKFHLLDTGNFQPSRGLDIQNFGDFIQGLSKNTGAPVGPAILRGGTPPDSYVPSGPRVVPSPSAEEAQPPVAMKGMPGTPASVTQPSAGQGRMSGAIGVLGSAISDLYKSGGISSTGNTTKQNLSAYVQQTPIGQEVGRAVGSNNQSLRDTINATIPMVLADLKVSAGLSAQQFNSNAELQFYQQAAQGGTDVVSRLAAIDALDQAYGTGTSLQDVLPGDLYKKVRERSAAMAKAHPPPPLEAPASSASRSPQDNTAIIQEARDAIARGAPAEAVIQRLKEKGIDVNGGL